MILAAPSKPFLFYMYVLPPQRAKLPLTTCPKLYMYCSPSQEKSLIPKAATTDKRKTKNRIIGRQQPFIHSTLLVEAGGQKALEGPVRFDIHIADPTRAEEDFSLLSLLVSSYCQIKPVLVEQQLTTNEKKEADAVGRKQQKTTTKPVV